MEGTARQNGEKTAKLDVLGSQFSDTTNFGQIGSASHANLPLLHPINFQINPQVHQDDPEKLFVGKIIIKTEVGLSGLGNSLQAKRSQRTGASRSRGGKQSHECQNMVEMGHTQRGTMGEIMAP